MNFTEEIEDVFHLHDIITVPAVLLCRRIALGSAAVAEVLQLVLEATERRCELGRSTSVMLAGGVLL